MAKEHAWRKSNPFLVKALTERRLIELAFLIGCWLAAEVYFWSYWLQAGHVVSVAGFLFNTALIAWFTALPAYFLFFLTRMKRTRPDLPLRPYRAGPVQPAASLPCAPCG